jgi:hypothetical protein
LRLAALVIGSVFVFSWFVINFQIRDYGKRLKIARVHLQNVEEIETIKQLVDLKEGLINEVNTAKVPAGGLLKLIGSVIPASIILNELDFDQAGHSMRLNGIVSAGEDSAEKVLTDFMNSLEDSKFVAEANLTSSKDEQGINSFEIECILAK